MTVGGVGGNWIKLIPVQIEIFPLVWPLFRRVFESVFLGKTEFGVEKVHNKVVEKACLHRPIVPNRQPALLLDQPVQRNVTAAATSSTFINFILTLSPFLYFA